MEGPLHLTYIYTEVYFGHNTVGYITRTIVSFDLHPITTISGIINSYSGGGNFNDQA